DGPYEEFKAIIEKLGETPIPKYIKREVEPEDAERYQTVYAKNEGAVAVLIVNNVAGDIPMGGGDAAITIPAYSLNQADGDPIVASLLAGATINATFNAPTAGFVNIDGDFDNGIIAHEYGHGIHIRTHVNGNTVNCSTGYSESLSEGWGDYIGKILQLSNVDNGIYISGTGTFAIGEPINGPGIRPAPYSGDIANNPMTYQTLRADAGNATYTIPHGVGSVLAGIFWDLTWDMIAVHGFEPDLYNHTSTAGNVQTLHILIESLKVTACRPGFVTTRDAILQADVNLYGGANECIIWSAFARRGVGANANEGSVFSTSDGAHDFSMPNGLGCNPDYLLTIGGPTDDCEGASLDYEIVFNAQNGWNTNVGFAVSGLPGGANATFSPTTISDTGLVTMTVTGLTAGDHAITVTPGGDTSKDLVLNVHVQENNPDLTDGDTRYREDGGSFTNFNDGATLVVNDGSSLDLRLPASSFDGTLLWTAPDGSNYTTNTVSFASILDGDNAVEGAWTVVPTFTLDCPGASGNQVINFTIDIQAAIRVTPQVYIEGSAINPNPAEPTLMRDDLRVAGLIPTTSPYGDALTVDPSVFTTTGADAIVDWVWVEVRDGADNTNILGSSSALLQRDGDVVSTNGTSPLIFNLPGNNYFVTVNHRNHLGIMSANSVALSRLNSDLNLINDANDILGGAISVVSLNGNFVLPGGDFDENAQVQTSDINGVYPLLGGFGYNNADMDMNGQYQNTDLNIINYKNVGRGQQY
ncbi:MAG: S-adenosylmethionine:tRNA ribosyltransferase-isomerase, partial [Flavobacteriaceae bacterium]|nr:S-adenosylmethionine:tRNA ribosyltransferase-isomerase [Flavobacteriaceae bacterium]